MNVTTKELARMLGIKAGNVHQAIYNNRISAPQKNASGDYVWNRSAVEKAALVMTGKKIHQPS